MMYFENVKYLNNRNHPVTLFIYRLIYLFILTIYSYVSLAGFLARATPIYTHACFLKMLSVIIRLFCLHIL